MQVKINGSEWEVLWVKKSNDKLVLDNERCLGITYFDEKCIYLNKGLSEKSFRKTVVHEFVHAFLYSYGIDLQNTNEDVEEIVCEFVENHYRKILKLTSKVVKAWKLSMMIKSFA